MTQGANKRRRTVRDLRMEILDELDREIAALEGQDNAHSAGLMRGLLNAQHVVTKILDRTRALAASEVDE
jgi:hypothetical protein